MPATASSGGMWLAPLRGVTIRAFRETFADAILEAGFTGAVAPFIPANPGIRVSRRLLADLLPVDRLPASVFRLFPQVISRHPDAMRELLRGFRDAGFMQADLNAGCPFPMIRNKGRGSGLLRTPDVLERMIEAGCAEMGPGNFSVKTRLGFDRPDELIRLMPLFNRYPLAALTVHARTARQMYEGACDRAALAEIVAASANPVIVNGDFTLDPPGIPGAAGWMTGRAFIRGLARRPDARELLARYIETSRAELCGDAPVLGRMKELLAYWAQETPRWKRLWNSVKICRTVDELRSVVR